MRLATICESDVRQDDPADDGRSDAPSNLDEADALFQRGLRAMREHRDEDAFHIFSRLCRYDGNAPPGLLRSARTARDFLDPRRPADQKAETLFKFFAPTVIHLSDALEDSPRS
jgi:hypothetical protein